MTTAFCILLDSHGCYFLPPLIDVMHRFVIPVSLFIELVSIYYEEDFKLAITIHRSPHNSIKLLYKRQHKKNWYAKLACQISTECAIIHV